MRRPGISCAGIDREPLALDQAGIHAGAHHSLKYLAQDVAVAEATMAIDRERRVIRHLVVEIEPTKPTVRKVKFEPAGAGAPQTSHIDDWRGGGRSPPDRGAGLRRGHKHSPRSAGASGQPLHSPTCPPS